MKESWGIGRLDVGRLDVGNNSNSTARTLESAHSWGILLYHRQSSGAAANLLRLHHCRLSGMGANDLITSFVARVKLSPLYFDVVDLVRPPNT